MKRDSLGILMFFEHHNHDFAARVGYGRSIGTLDKYRVVKKHLTSFIWDRYGKKDISLDGIRPQFVLDFDAWLRRKRGLAPNSVWGYMITLKHIIESGKMISTLGAVHLVCITTTYERKGLKCGIKRQMRHKWK